jgi:serine/threonine protein kinase
MFQDVPDRCDWLQGDLKQYLRDCRPTKPDPLDTLTSDDLMAMVMQISGAMRYLEQKKVIHRDLAAR